MASKAKKFIDRFLVKMRDIPITRTFIIHEHEKAVIRRL